MPGAKFAARSRACGVVAMIEAISLFVYCIVLTIAAFNSSGATESAPIVEIGIFLIFAIGIFLIARGLFGVSINARAPFFVTQIFVLIVAYTLLVGDGVPVRLAGALIAVLGLAGLGFGIAMIIADSDDKAAAKRAEEEEAAAAADPGDDAIA